MSDTRERTARRLLVIRAGALGDCLLLLPVLVALRAHFPHARIEVMGYPERWEWVLGRGHVDAVHTVDRPGMHLLFCRGAEVPEPLRAFFSGYDVILSYRPDPDGVFAENLRLLGAGRVLNQSPFPPPPPPKVHIADYALRLVADLGVCPPPHPPRLPQIPQDLTLVEPFLRSHRIERSTERLLVIHPGSGSRAKRWPIANFAALLEALASCPRLRTVVVIGYAEVDLLKQLLPLITHHRPLIAAGWPLRPTAALIAQATVFVGHDSGLTHLSAAFGRPTVALFGPTDAAIWGPQGEAVTVVQMEREVSADSAAQRKGDTASSASGTLHQVITAVTHWLALADARRSPGDRSA